jgi:predicted PurR-regulated permease PerM
MKRYMIIKTLLNLVVAILVTVLLTILRVDFPVLWGFLAFLLNYVPTIGSTIAAVPAVLLAFLQFGPLRGALAAAGYVVINFGLAYGVEVKLMGQKLGLSTLVVFLSLIFWGSVLGPIGAVLCIPLTMTLKFAFESNESTRWIAVLLGPEDTRTTTEPRPERRAVPRCERKPKPA